ncbi:MULTISPECIES: LysE family translocator [unclassified Xanthomonas]|uniref:LysE family translocator n=1 Tax=unclassified Xanthomonas TaxID=2643310 RepID=UPI001368C497|nr:MULTISPECIES: LysE family translocator [unclassified Xanthomonas]MXV33082.1 LysE family translocator [Xanthomonas sp. LMG 8989]
MNIAFLFTSLLVVASPGTGALVTLAAGLSRGARAAVVAALGCTLGILPHMLAAITGLAALLRASALAFDAVQYAGVAYLLYMAWMTLKADGPLKIEPDGSVRSDGQVIRQAILANLLNPKLSIFFFAFLPQFVGRGEARPTLRMLGLSSVFMAMTFVVFVAYGVFAAGVRDRILSRPAILKWMRRGFAAAFVGLGAKLALLQR